MMLIDETHSQKTIARTAGLLYLGVVVTGIISLAHVPSQLIVPGDPSRTLQNIVSSETLFRLGIVSGLACYILFLFLPLALYRLLKSVNEAQAKRMALLAIVSVPISFLNMEHKLTVLSLIDGPPPLRPVSPDQLPSLVAYHLEQYDNGIRLVSIFWGLWLFPFGRLVYRSGFLPKVLGIFLMLGCLGYLTNFLGRLLIPDYSKMGVSSWVSLPASVGEIGICLWLLVWGVRGRKVVAR